MANTDSKDINFFEFGRVQNFVVRQEDQLVRPIFFTRIDDSHCDRIHSALTVVRCFDSGYVGKQPMASKEYCARRCLKELSRKAWIGTLSKRYNRNTVENGVKHHTINQQLRESNESPSVMYESCSGKRGLNGSPYLQSMAQSESQHSYRTVKSILINNLEHYKHLINNLEHYKVSLRELRRLTCVDTFCKCTKTPFSKSITHNYKSP